MKNLKIKKIAVLVAGLSLSSVSFADIVFSDGAEAIHVEKPANTKHNSEQKPVHETKAIDFVQLTKDRQSQHQPLQLQPIENQTAEPAVKKNRTVENSKVENNKPAQTKNTIQNIRATGLKNVPVQRVGQIIGVKEGSVLQDDSEVAMIEHRLSESGFFKSSNVRFEPNYGYLELNLVENPLVEKVNVDGARTIRESVIKDNMKRYGIGEGGVFNPILLKEYLNRLNAEYYDLGKEKIHISLTPKPLPDDKMELTIKVNEGATSKIDTINFIGNEAFSDKELKRLLTVNEKSALTSLFSANKLNHNKLRHDLEVIVDHYQNHGYLESQIVDVKFIEKKDSDKDIQVIIKEGNVYHLGKPKFNFTSSVKDTGLINKISNDPDFLVIKNGNLYRKDDIIQLNQNIKQYLSNQGYAFSKVDIEAKPLENNLVEFTITVDAGNKFKINNINVSGNEKTETGVILREMRQQTGEVFDLSKMQRSKERLDLTGYFNEVEMNTRQVGEDAVDIDINVKERKTGTLQFTAGYMQDYGVTLGIGAEDRNFLGKGKSLSGSINYNRIHKYANIGYEDPFFFKNGTSLATNIYGSIYDPRKQENNYQHYKTSKYGVGFNFGLPLNEYNKLYIGANIENLSLHTYDNAPQKYRQFIMDNSDKHIDGVGKYSGVVAKATLGWGRNTTNHAYWPTRGYITNLSGEITLPGSKLDYYKLNASNKFFFPIGKSSSLILNTRIGYGNSYGRTTELPFFENYYAGGLGTVRGFESSTMGAKVYDRYNSVVTYGGNKLVVAGLEFQTPVPFIKDSSNVRLGAFIDAGSVWDGKTYTAKDSDNGVSMYGDKPHKSSFSSEFRASAGIAYTWLSPIGPVKFSYAVPLRKRPEDQIQRFQFQLGTTF